MRPSTNPRRVLLIRTLHGQEAMENFVHEMLHDSPAALKIMSLWKEYEDQSTAEARFVKGGLRGRAVGPTAIFFALFADACVRSR